MQSIQPGATIAAVEHRFVTIDELAARLCRNSFTLYHWLTKAPERLPRVTRIHGRVLFLEADVRAYFEAFEAGGTAKIGAGAPTPDSALPKRPRGRPRKAEEISRRASDPQQLLLAKGKQLKNMGAAATGGAA
jgi:hypothetical protein